MLPSVTAVLTQREGTLAKVPFPLLLGAVAHEKRTCTLELKLRNLEKRIAFEDGAAVECTSNLLHETLGKYLVGKTKLTEQQYQTLLNESATTGKAMGTLLVEKQLLPAFELFRHLQANLAHKLLDVFKWSDAKWRITDPEPVATPIRLNVHQLIFTGCAHMPPEMVEAHLPLRDEQGLGLTPNAADDLKLKGKDARLLQLLKGKPALGALCASLNTDRRAVLPKLLALFVLERVAVVEAAPPPAGSTVRPPAVPDNPAPALTPPPPSLSPPSPAAPEDDEPARNQLLAEFLSHRLKDPFELLGVGVDVKPGALQQAFLGKAQLFSPQRYTSAELKEKAETLLLAAARAYGALCEPEGLQLHTRRREVALEGQRRKQTEAAADHFKIRTSLLDADSQFEEGLKRLGQGHARQAVEYFEYACDIEPKARFVAYLAWARYRAAPEREGPRALNELAEACASEPECEEAWAFRGDVGLALNQLDVAEDCYRKAYKLNPAQRRYPEAIAKLAKRKKG